MVRRTSPAKQIGPRVVIFMAGRRNHKSLLASLDRLLFIIGKGTTSAPLRSRLRSRSRFLVVVISQGMEASVGLNGIEPLPQQTPQASFPGQLDDSEGEPPPQRLAQFLAVLLVSGVTDECEDKPALIHHSATRNGTAKVDAEARANCSFRDNAACMCVRSSFGLSYGLASFSDFYLAISWLGAATRASANDSLAGRRM